MNGTPARRGPGGFPGTPQTSRSPKPGTSTSTPGRPNVRSPLPNVPRAEDQARSGPLIPTDVLDAASQRAYLFLFYVLLTGWKLYDFYTLAVEEDQSLVSCLKWCFLDMVFIFGVPLLEIPWLEWSNGAAFILFVLHAGLDVMLMFRIGVSMLVWLWKTQCLTDLGSSSSMGSLASGLSVGQRAGNQRAQRQAGTDSAQCLSHSRKADHQYLTGRVRQPSLLLRVANIARSAILNPDKQSFCLNSTVTQLEIPILINQTEPIEIELLRIDIESNQNETISIKSRELKNLLKKARKATKSTDPASPLLLRHTIKKTGIYLLQKVLDQSKLEVRPRLSSVIIATCPSARVKPTAENRCRNDLSDVTLEVEGIPPLSIKYRLTVNNKPREASEFQGLQPDDYISPLPRHTSQALIRSGREDVSWAKSQKLTVALNETLTSSGIWEYAIEEVKDALGNFVSYVGVDDEERPRAKVASAPRSFKVHERPTAFLDKDKCNTQKPLRVAKGQTALLPVRYGSTGRGAINSPYKLEYLFTPESKILVEGQHSQDAELRSQTLKSALEQPMIQDSGLYTVKSISTQFCKGDVLEPASCLLQNPPVPELSITSEDIVDKCAGNPIGLRVELDLIGTPPFKIKYTRQHGHRPFAPQTIEIDGLRSTIDFAPEEKAGQYTWTFNSIQDGVYDQIPLKDLVLSQSIKPLASAKFVGSEVQQACIDDSAEFDVGLRGEGPWTLEYEVFHNGKRKKYSVDVEEPHYLIKTEKLTSGGEHTVALASVTDKSGCKIPLQQQAKVQVRHERPKAYFGHIEGKQTIMALDDKSVDLPLRLTGTGPWTLKYKNLDSGEEKNIPVRNANDHLSIKGEGIYQLLAVQDSVCPGYIDEKANQFSVDWVPRPKLTIPESASIVLDGGHYIKEAVCEGDEDAFDVALTGKSHSTRRFLFALTTPQGMHLSS